jgi:hypothetical protein
MKTLIVMALECRSRRNRDKAKEAIRVAFSDRPTHAWTAAEIAERYQVNVHAVSAVLEELHEQRVVFGHRSPRGRAYVGTQQLQVQQATRRSLNPMRGTP